LRSSDQRIAEVSKLPEIAVVPSADTARARTGPPCPRNCALATPAANTRLAAAAHNLSENDCISHGSLISRARLRKASPLPVIWVALGYGFGKIDRISTGNALLPIWK
jgi:hypothetical protein